MMRPYTLLLSLVLAAHAWALTATVDVMRHSYCGRPSGQAAVWIDGGVPPYTIAWSNGTTDSWALGLFPGTYSVTVTDSQAEEVTVDFTILETDYNGAGAASFYTLSHCPEDPGMAMVFTGVTALEPFPPPEGQYGPQPYTFSHPMLVGELQSTPCQVTPGEMHHLLQFDGAEPGYYMVDFWDGDGCPGQVQVVVGPSIQELPLPQVVEVVPSCASTATGSITYTVPPEPAYDHKTMLRPAAVTDQCSELIWSRVHENWSTGATFTVNNLLPGDYWLISTNDLLNLYTGVLDGYACADSFLVTVPSLGTDCGRLSGRVFVDDDANCTYGGTENRIPGAIVEILPGPHYVTTDNTGYYSIGLNFGDYTVTEQHPVFEQSCAGEVTLAAGSQTFNVGCAGGEPLNLDLDIANGPARPGFELHYGLSLENLTPASTGTVTLTVTLDPTLSFISANPAPSSVAGNVLTWTTPQLVMNQIFQERNVSIRTQVPPDVLLIGSTLTTTAQLASANTDGDLSNNTAVSAQVVTGSFDPNDKRATTSTGNTEAWILDADEWIDYTIRFQNTGTDTAFNVVITDTLPDNLDPGSIEWGAASHPHTRQLQEQGVLKFIFANILLPDSTINEPLSHGFVSFRIKPNLPLLPGDQITNIANIYFDFNPPVITEPSVLVAEFSTGVAASGTLDRQLIAITDLAQGTLRLSAPGHTLIDGLLRDMNGRIVLHQGLHSDAAILNVSALASGAYIAEVHTTHGHLLRTKVLLTR
ncbi:MAG: DUF11 domain-containing protein [Flavobacteriales bacterium]|nr:DUF11 domain-containing protein [Flavobacteriales bacterium]